MKPYDENGNIKTFNEREHRIGSEAMGQLVFEGDKIIDLRPKANNTGGIFQIYQVDGFEPPLYILSYDAGHGSRHLYIVKVEEIETLLKFHGCDYTKSIMTLLHETGRIICDEYQTPT